MSNSGCAGVTKAFGFTSSRANHTELASPKG